MTTPHHLHLSLLRPSVLHILRSVGFHSARPSVIDTLVDITSRYLLLLVTRTSVHASIAHNEPSMPTISDVRMALQDVGAFYPSISDMEEQVRRPLLEQGGEKRGDMSGEDMRGIEVFLGWMTGTKNREIRRIAEMASEGYDIGHTVDGTANAPEALNPPVAATAIAEEEGKKEDFLTVLKKKHSKTGEESRYQGTLLGKSAEARETKIEGGAFDSLQVWESILKGYSSQSGENSETHQRQGSKVAVFPSNTSSPLTDIGNV